MRPPVTAVVIAFNEERKIARCLDSVRGLVDDVFVLDSGSTDGTRALCEARGARVEVEPFRGYIAQKNEALDRARTDWVLSLDADEEVSPELARSVTEALASPAADAYEMNRRSFYCDRWVRFSGWYPDRKIRLFRRTCGRWTGVDPHDRFAPGPAAKIARLRGDLLHHYVATRAEHEAKVRRFAAVAARAMLARGESASAAKIWLKTVNGFFRAYVWHAGFLDGAAGFSIARYAALEKYLKYGALRDLRRAETRP
jgi:glycosyltransferase involved in cell wall biosynthesis